MIAPKSVSSIGPFLRLLLLWWCFAALVVCCAFHQCLLCVILHILRTQAENLGDAHQLAPVAG